MLYIGLIHPFLTGMALVIIAIIYSVIAYWLPSALRLAVEYHDTKQDIVFNTSEGAAPGERDGPKPKPAGTAIIATGPRPSTHAAKQELIDRLQNKQDRFLRIVGTQSRILIAATAIGNVALLGLGMYLIFDNQMTVAQLVATEVAYSPALLAALQSGNSLSNAYEVVSNLHLMRRLRQQDEAPEEQDQPPGLPLPVLPSWVVGKPVRAGPTFVLLGISALIGAALILVFAPWVQTIRMEGQVLPLDASAREQAIESPYEGRLVRNLVTEGETVVQGQKLAEIGHGKRVETIVAPRRGKIVAITAFPGSSYVDKGEALFQFLPASNQRIIRFAVPVKEGYVVNVGDRVFLQFRNWPSVQFVGWPNLAVSTFEGRVRSVAEAPGADNLLTIDVVEDQGVARSWPDQRFVGRGTSVEGHVELATVTVGYELWRSLNGFPPEFRSRSETTSGDNARASQTVSADRVR